MRHLFWMACLLCLAVTFGCNPNGPATPKDPAPADSGKKAPQPDQAKPETPEKKVGGRYEVLGTTGGTTGGSMVSESGNQLKNEPIEIKWAVNKGAFEKLREGMTLDEARKLLGLSALSYAPRGEASEFQLVCKQGAVSVTLNFAGSPEVKLKSKSAKGFK